MMYLEDFTDKYGFNDGEALPTGVEYYRAAYCVAINKRLIHYNSDCRVLPFNRGGCHNPMLIATVDVNTYQTYKHMIGKLEGVECSVTEIKADKVYDQSVYEAEDMYTPDDLVEVKIKFTKRFRVLCHH